MFDMCLKLLTATLGRIGYLISIAYFSFFQLAYFAIKKLVEGTYRF